MSIEFALGFDVQSRRLQVDRQLGEWRGLEVVIRATLPRRICEKDLRNNEAKAEPVDRSLRTNSPKDFGLDLGRRIR